MTFQLMGDGPKIYEEVMVPLWFGRWAEALVDVMAQGCDARVLDVACGTGVTTRHARRRIGAAGRVDGLDINAPMLAMARDLADGLDIGWIESDVCHSGLPSGTYDVVMAQHGYHYFPDQPGALAEFRRLLVPGGRVGFSIWDGHSPYTRALCDAVERHISPQIADKQRAQRQTPPAEVLRDHLHRAGFGDIEIHRQELMIDVPLAAEFVPLHLASMPIAGAFAALAGAARSALADDVGTALGSYVTGDRLVYPDAVHVAVGTKPAV